MLDWLMTISKQSMHMIGRLHSTIRAIYREYNYTLAYIAFDNRLMNVSQDSIVFPLGFDIPKGLFDLFTIEPLDIRNGDSRAQTLY